MGLSYDLISEFVKVTNDTNEKPTEGIVYATIVKASDGKYVKIDGSDLLTPTDTTTDIEDGERVTVMIKDHTATVTGNVSSPSASSVHVDRVTESLSEKIGTFELVVADKVSTNELEAYKATVEVLLAGKATIDDLEATNATIENLKAKDAEIENLVADKATIEDLEAFNAEIDNLKAKDAEIENAVVENLEATTADIKILNADFAQIKTLVNGNLTSDNILSFNLTSEKVTVDDAFIKDAMIDTVSAAKINAGQINTDVVSIGSEDGGMLITGSTQQFTDKNGNVRIQIGKDASGDFTFILYGEDGTGQIINQNGITASAIGDGLIVNDMVNDNAAISGSKLDISSVITEINSDNSTTIHSNKIYLDGQSQSLEVAFNSLKTQVDTIQEVSIEGDLSAVIEQVQSNTTKIEANTSSINTLISEDTTIKQQITDLENNVVSSTDTLTSKYTSLDQSLEGFKTTVADTYATKASVTDVANNLSSNYSTTSVMNSAIDQKANEITASVSSTYATKTEINNKINDLSISGVNRVLDSGVSKSSTIVSAANQSWSPYYISGDVRNQTVTIAFDYVATDIVKNDNYIFRFQPQYTDSNGTIMYYPSYSLDIPDGNSSGTIVISSLSFGNIKEGANASFRFRFDYVSGTFQISKARAFIGSKDLGWSQAPEDIESSINAKANSSDVYTKTEVYTIEETDSKINIAKNEINLGVSQTYETKTNVESKITTAKNEAISSASENTTSQINNAKTELNNAINAKANSSDVYTKTEVYTIEETDSKINIAKNEINLGVSQTYETKTNVESKVSSALNSANSYTDNKTSEAILAASEDATTKVDNLEVSGVNRAFKTSTPSEVLTLTNSSNQNWKPYSISEDVRNQTVTIAFDYMVTDIVKNDNYRMRFQSQYTDPNDTIIYSPTYDFDIPDGSSSGTIVTPPLRFGDIKEGTVAGFRFRFDYVSGTFQISKARVFIGSKDLGWSQAPEDIDDEMSVIEYETKTIKESVSSLTLGVDSINASVKSLEESFTNTTDGLANDISIIQDQVNLAMTSSDVQIEIQKQLSNGVNKVTTSTGFIFDDTGLNISKSDSEMNTQITEDGMQIYKNDEIMLTANNQGVDAKNLHATTYLIIGGNSRMEDFTEDGSKRTAVFWIG